MAETTIPRAPRVLPDKERKRVTAERVKVPVVRPLQRFLRLEAAIGIHLLFCAVTALVSANIHGESYRAVFEYPFTIGAGASVTASRSSGSSTTC